MARLLTKSNAGTIGRYSGGNSMQNTDPTKVSGWMGKYRSIIFAVGLFIVFDLVVLMATFFMSHRMADDTAALNLVNRQRMLSQPTVKALITIQVYAAKCQLMKKNT